MIAWKSGSLLMTVENIGHEEDQRFELCLGVKPKIFVNYVKRGEKRRKKKSTSCQLKVSIGNWDPRTMRGFLH